MMRSWNRRRTAVTFGLAAVVGLGLAPTAVGHAAAPRPAKANSFGAKLTTHSDPANFNAAKCSGQGSCSRIMTEAYHRAAAFVAPKTGTIGTISLVGVTPGSFRLQVAKIKGTGSNVKAKLVSNGPTISYTGQTGGEDNGPPYTIETFKVKVPIEKGQVLAVKARKISFAYCSGGSGVAEFTPPLAKSKTFTKTTGQEDCLLLLEATYK